MALKNASATRYKCCSCGRVYTDLEVDQLLNVSKGILECPNCDTELESSVDESSEARQLSIKLNRNLTSLFLLLKKVSHFDLDSRFLDPSGIAELEDDRRSEIAVAREREEQNQSGRETGKAKTNFKNNGEKGGIQIRYTSRNDLLKDMPYRRRIYPRWISHSTITGDLFLPQRLDRSNEQSYETVKEYRDNLDRIYNDLCAYELKGFYGKPKAPPDLARMSWKSRILHSEDTKPWEMNAVFNWYLRASSR